MSKPKPKPMKLRLTIVTEIVVDDLSHYGEAKTLEEAAKSTKKMFEDGSVGAEEMLAWGNHHEITVEAVKD